MTFEGSSRMVDPGKKLNISVLTEFLRSLGKRFQAIRKKTDDDRPITPEAETPDSPDKYQVIEQVRRRMSSMGDIMKLQIVWRNPLPPRAMKLRVRQIVADAYGALYEVRSAHDVKVFEMLERGAA